MREKLIELLKEADRYEFEEQKKSGTFSIEAGWKLIADNLIANGVTIATDNNVGHKWIPVTERLPEGEELVLMLCKNGAMFVGYCGKQYCDFERRWRIKTALNSTKLLNLGRVTHWMPLPSTEGLK